MSEARMNIAISVNDSFVNPALVMLTSLCEKVSCPIEVHLLYNSLSQTSRDRITKLLQKYGNHCYEHYIDGASFAQASLNNNPLYSIEIYYRILLPYITAVDKMLWMDADIIVQGDIAQLYGVDISDSYLGAVIDIGEEQGTRAEIKRKMSMEERTYFNSGVLLMNLKRIREEIPQKAFFDAIERFNSDLRCPDQDILNYVLGGKTKILPIRFNDQHHTDEKRRMDCSGLVVHYIWTKPWNADYAGYWEKAYWETARKCGFAADYWAFLLIRKWKFYRTEVLPAIGRRLGVFRGKQK